MSNETDLDWLARNVHEWPSGDHQPWCYVYMAYGGVIKASGNFLDAVAKPTMITIDQWLARRAELQNKPAEWPKRANWLAQHDGGEWTFYSDSADNPPQHRPDGNWYSDDVAVRCRHIGEVLGDWRDTLELRPTDLSESAVTERLTEATKTVLAAASALMDEEFSFDRGDWFERGELPPVGAECEHRSARSDSYSRVLVVGHGELFSVKVAFYASSYNDENFTCSSAEYFRPIRTERDVLLSVIVEEMNHYDTDGKLADAILAAGFKRDGGAA